MELGKHYSKTRNGDYLEGMISDYVGRKIQGRNNKGSRRLVASLTCLQFAFAIYATFLLYFMSPSIDLIHVPHSVPWATHIAKHWKEFMHSDLHEYIPQAPATLMASTKQQVCEQETIDFNQKKSTDNKMIKLKTELYSEIIAFQKKSMGIETLEELMRLPSVWNESYRIPKITVILNHFKRKTLCAQLESLLHQTLPFYSIWVLAFGSPNEHSLRQIVETYSQNNSRISFVASTYDFKYYGRFQMALQAEEADYVYVLDDDMIPGRKMLHLLAHTAGTEKYKNAVLGSIGRILPFRQKDFTFPSYRKYGAKEAGLYLPDPAYDIIVERIVHVDFLSSSWFLSADLVKTLFVETPFTFMTGEDLHLSYQLQKYRNANSFVLPTDPNDRETWGDSEHRLAYVSETTVIHKDIVQVRDDQWWRTLSRGYITQWSLMNPQQIDALFYAHSLDEVVSLAPLLTKFRSVVGKKAYIVVSGGSYCPCHEAAKALAWPIAVCHERRFKIFDLEVGSVSRSETTLIQEIYSSMSGLIKIHNPSLIITVADVDPNVRDAVKLAASRNGNATALVHLPRSVVPHVLWMADLRQASLPYWNKMRISINIVTQNRPLSLQRLLKSILTAHYVGDEITLTFNMDSRVDAQTLTIVKAFDWPHGTKIIRRRIIQGGLIRAVSESWYPSSDHDFGLLLEDDIEVSPYYYLWLKYTLLAYHYDPHISLPQLNSIALYTPKIIEVVKERPRWNATDFFLHKSSTHPNTPYLHQLPCSWGALFFPKHWREFYKYMATRFTENAKENPVQIPKSRTNGWQASWKKFLIDMMYLRGYVSLYPNFPHQMSFSTNHMEPGAHINASNNVVKHNKEDFEVPLLQMDFRSYLPDQKLPSASKLPVLNLFNQPTSLKGLKSAGAKLGQDVLQCNITQVVAVDHATGMPSHCATF